MEVEFLGVGDNGFGGFIVSLCYVVHDMLHVELDFV